MRGHILTQAAVDIVARAWHRRCQAQLHPQAVAQTARLRDKQQKGVVYMTCRKRHWSSWRRLRAAKSYGWTTIWSQVCIVLS